MTHRPTVQITYANLLQNVRIANQPEPTILTFDQAEDKAEAYRTAWSAKETLVLDGMQDCMDLSFRTPLIDVALAPWTYRAAISFPLIVDMAGEPDEFVDFLTHELFHELFANNQIITTKNQRSQSRLQWEKLFGSEHSGSTLVHIAVHAACKYMYLDVHHEPYRLARDIEHASHLPDYAKAWEYVEQHDYREIIAKLKQRYQEIANQKEIL